MKKKNKIKVTDRYKKPVVAKKTATSGTIGKYINFPKWTNLLFLISSFILVFVLYGNTVLNKYAIDDEIVTDNPIVKQGIKAIPQIFSSRYISNTGNVGSIVSEYRPVAKATFALEYQLWGEKPGRSHIINVLIYWAVSVLLFFTLKRILKQYHVLFPLLITFLFMLHPIHTEVVASLKNREELLAFLCGLGGLNFLLRYVEKRKIYYLFCVLLIFFIGYITKPSIVPFLALYLLVLYFFTDLPLKKYLPILIGIVVIGLISQYGPKLFLPPTQRVNHFIENPLFFNHNIWIRLGTSLSALLFYLKMMVFPYPMLYYYGYNMIPLTDLADIRVLLSLAIYGGLLVFALLKFRKKHFLSFAILWYMIAIFIYSNLPGPVVGIVGERFLFLASLGFCMALAYVVFLVFRVKPESESISATKRLLIICVLVLIMVPSVALTIHRNRDWRNLFSLYHADIKHLENSAKANTDYAGFLMKTVYQDEVFLRYGRVNEFKEQIIVSHFRQALEIYPDSYSTLNDLGTVYLFIAKNYDSAVYFLQKAIQLDSAMQPAWVNLGMAYRQQHKFAQALNCYERILKVNPGQIKAVFAMANVYNDMGDFDKAVKMNEDVMKAYPKLEMPYVNIGNYYMGRRDTVRAVKYWEKAAEINPTYELCVQLNGLYQIRGDRVKTEYYYNLGNAILKRTR